MKKSLSLAIRFAVSFGILYYLLRFIPTEKVFETIASVNIGLVVLVILLTQLMTYVSAMKSKTLTDEHNLSLTVGKIFEINYVTQFYGLFLPEVISSGLIRWHKLSTADRKPAEALAAMIFCRYVEVIMFISVGLLFWTFDRRADSNDYLGILFGVSLLGGVVIYYLAFNRKIAQHILGTLTRIQFIPKSLIEKLRKVLLATSHYHGLKRPTLLRVILLNAFKDLIGIICFYLLARSVNIHVDFATIAWVRSIVLLLALLPISVSGFGIQEGSLIFFLGQFGFPTPSVLVFSFLLHLRKFIGGAIGGLIQAGELVISRPNKPEVKKAN